MKEMFTFRVADAARYGVKQAVVLEALRIIYAREDADKMTYNGRTFARATYQDIADMTAFLTVESVGYCIRDLSLNGAIISMQFRERDRANYYTILDK